MFPKSLYKSRLVAIGTAALWELARRVRKRQAEKQVLRSKLPVRTLR